MKIGDKIKMRENQLEEGKRIVYGTYEVIAIYPYHVLTVNEHGMRRCFSIGDLVTHGLVRQDIRGKVVI